MKQNRYYQINADRIHSDNTKEIMKKLLLTSIILVFLMPITYGHTSGTVDKTCPVCEQQFEAEMDMSGTQTGIRLDLKPLGFTAAPWRVAVCPKCNFVLYKDELSDQEREKLKGFLASEDYKRLVSDKHSSYYLLANILKYMAADSFDVGYSYLEASWQVEKDESKRYHEYLNKSLACFLAIAEQGGTEKEDATKTAAMLTGEILRQLSRFKEAKAHFDSFAGQAEYKKQPYRAIVSYELELISAKDADPKSRAPIVLTQDDKMELPEYRMCYGLKDFDEITKLFTVSQVDMGCINGLPESLLLTLDPNAKNEALVNSAWWFNPLDEKTKQPLNDSHDFIKCYREVNDVATKHKWLASWRNAESGRTVEASIFGTRPYTNTCLDNLVVPGWKHAGMKGDPLYEIALRRSGKWCGTAYFGKEDSRAFLATIYPGKSEHWIDKQDFSYHPTQETPEYIIVDQEGTWHKNTKTRMNTKSK